MSIGERIYNLRKEKGLSQEQLANKLNVSRQSVSKWELGESNPELTNIVELANIFNVSTDYLINNREFVDKPNINHNNQKLEKYKVMMMISTMLLVLAVPLFFVGTISPFLGIILSLMFVIAGIFIFILGNYIYKETDINHYHIYKKYSLIFFLTLFYVLFGIIQLFFNFTIFRGLPLNIGYILYFVSSIIIMKKYQYEFKKILITFIIISLIMLILVNGPFIIISSKYPIYVLGSGVRLLLYDIVSLIYTVFLIRNTNIKLK